MGGTRVYGNVRYRVPQKGMWPPGKHIPFNLYDNMHKTFLAGCESVLNLATQCEARVCFARKVKRVLYQSSAG